MSRWFRHYAGMMRDDKLVRVAIRSKQTIERVVWVYAAILESAAEVDDDGRYDFDAAEAAYFLRADQADIDGIVSGLSDSGRLHEGRVAKWGDRQFQSDRSAERQKRYRERRKQHEDTGSDVHPERSDGGVTSPSRHRDAPETETETEETGSNEPSGRELWSKPPVSVGKQIWADFKHNRKNKRLGFTVSTYTNLRKDLERVSLKTGIPPPDLLEYAAAHGWGGIYDPNERKNGHERSTPGSLSEAVTRILGNGGIDGRAGESAGPGSPDYDDHRTARALAARGS